VLGARSRVPTEVARSPQPAEALGVEKFEQLGLRHRVDLGDFVQEQCPAVGQLDQPDLLRARVGERTRFVAEQLALEQIGGEGGAIDLDEGARRGARSLVDGVREETLSDPRLAQQQDRRRIALGHAVDQLQHALDDRAGPDDRVDFRGALGRARVLLALAAQVDRRQRLLHQRAKRFFVHRLQDECARLELHDAAVEVLGVARDAQDDLRTGRDRTSLFECGARGLQRDRVGEAEDDDVDVHVFAVELGRLEDADRLRDGAQGRAELLRVPVVRFDYENAVCVVHRVTTRSETLSV